MDLAEPIYMIDNARFDMVNSKYALTSICNIFMNITVLEPKFVDKNSIFLHLFKFVMNVLPKLQNSGDLLVLYGNLTVLGLLILKHKAHQPNSADYTVFKFIQAVIT